MQGHRIGSHRRVQPGRLQAGDLCGGLSLTPSFTCLGRVLLWAGSSSISPSPASCSGPLGWCPLGHPPQHRRIPADPHMPPGSERGTSASLLLALVPPAHTELGPFPPPGWCCDRCPLLFSTESLLPSPRPPTASRPRTRRARSPTATHPAMLPSDNEGRPCSLGPPSWHGGA